jgi:activator of 2-hydroxyglutaryl-CoA dehydratase
METFADMLNKGISEIGDIGLQCTQFPKIGDFCAVYAQSEALDFMKDEVQVEQVIAAYHDAMARRLRTLVSRFGMEKDFVVIGGLAKNPQLRARLEGILNTDILAPKTEWGPSFTTALGAAFFANSSVSRQKFAA